MSTVDCSRYQGVLSVAVLQAWKAAGVTRVILKAGGGDSVRYQDSQWVTNSANVQAAGLILEAYWFNGTTDPAGDAAFLLSFVPAGIRIWADVESEGSMPHWSDDQADVFERAVIAAGHPSGTYMSASVTFGSWPKCGRRPLWVAGYGFNSVPAVGPSWAAPVLWQYTSSGHLPGYGGYLDLDQDLAGIAGTGTPIGDEFDMASLTDLQNIVDAATVGIKDAVRRESRGRLFYCPTPPAGLPNFVVIFENRDPGQHNILYCNGGEAQADHLNTIYGQTGDTVAQAKAAPDSPQVYATRIALAAGTDSAFTNASAK
jgi:GH25 family lysozyme M1 (1,4-beta-N-acetylmuramidase)